MTGRSGNLDDEDERMPSAVRRGAIAVGVVLVTGALYLIIVRGEAIVVDLSGLASRLWCF